MATWTVTTRSTVYSHYEVEAETEEEARRFFDWNDLPYSEESEDTEIYDVTSTEDN